MSSKGASPWHPSIADWTAANAARRMSDWSTRERERFEEVLLSMRGELHRELVLRVVAMGHSPAEVRGFAEAIRNLSEDEAFAACVAGPGAARPQAAFAQLQAEADPIYGYLLNGHPLKERSGNGGADFLFSPGAKGRLPVGLPPPGQRPAEDSVIARGPKANGFDEAEPSSTRSPVLKSAKPGTWLQAVEDAVNESVKPLGLRYVRHEVDLRGPTLEKALDEAGVALGRGQLVPALLGSAVAEHRRAAIFLQLKASGKSRVFQLHDPFAQETVWVNEADLVGRSELPFSSKQFRRITALLLPTTA